MKNCDFSISPFLACIDVRDLQCSQRNESVQSQLVFLSTTNSSRVLATNFREFFEKKTIFNEHPVPFLQKNSVMECMDQS